MTPGSELHLGIIERQRGEILRNDVREDRWRHTCNEEDREKGSTTPGFGRQPAKHPGLLLVRVHRPFFSLQKADRNSDDTKTQRQTDREGERKEAHLFRE